MRFNRLPVELKAKLSNPRRPGIADNPKRRVGDISLGIHKICIVEDVEKFHTNVESQTLFNSGMLQQAEIRVDDSRTVEKATIGGSKRSRNAVLCESTHTRQASRRCRVTRDCRCRKVRGWRDEVASRVVGRRAIRIRLARIQNL